MLFAFFIPASAAKLTRARAPVKGVGSEGARGGASDHYHRKVRGNGPRLCAERQPQRLRGGVRVGIISPPFGHSGVLRLVLRTQPRSGGSVQQLSHLVRRFISPLTYFSGGQNC